MWKFRTDRVTIQERDKMILDEEKEEEKKKKLMEDRRRTSRKVKYNTLIGNLH